MRLFVAVPLPEAVKGALEETGKLLGRGLPRGAVRWVRPAQMHLTLFFLGETAVSRLPSIQNELALLGKHHAPFLLRLNGLGAFPNQRKPRVIWAGLGGDVAALQALQADVTGRLVNLGWQAEKRPFRPHLTLGRVRDFRRVQQMNWDVGVESLEIGVTAIRLMQSELRPSGAVYTVKQTVLLAPTRLSLDNEG